MFHDVILCYACGADLAEKGSGLYLPDFRNVVCEYQPRSTDPGQTCLGRFMRERGEQHIDHIPVDYAEMVNLLRDGSIRQHDISSLFL